MWRWDKRSDETQLVVSIEKFHFIPSKQRLFSRNIDTDIDLHQRDHEVHSLIAKEWSRQVNSLELIASENYVSKAVLQTLGSCLTNKYSEGLPHARYYGGNENIDQIETLCQQRAISLFSLDPKEWSVNVQPYSGTPANFAVYTALLQPFDTLMGLDLPSGGHLSHGYQLPKSKKKISASSIFFHSIPYHVRQDTGFVDYDELQSLAEQHRPKLIIAGASAYPRDWDYKRMRRIADSVNASLMADMAHIAGFVATKLCNDPFEHCDVVTTTTHKSLRGPRSGMIFYRMKYQSKIDSAVFPALQGGPHNHQIAAVAVALKEAAESSFVDYVVQVRLNAKELARSLQQIGYDVVTNGTDNHIVLWNVTRTGLSGSQMEKLLENCSISVNKNTIVGDMSAMNPRGIRLGTLAMTTRGMKESDMQIIAKYLDEAVKIGSSICQSIGKDIISVKEFVDNLSHVDYRSRIQGLRHKVESHASSFPLVGLDPDNNE